MQDIFFFLYPSNDEAPGDIPSFTSEPPRRMGGRKWLTKIYEKEMRAASRVLRGRVYRLHVQSRRREVEVFLASYDERRGQKSQLIEVLYTSLVAATFKTCLS